MATLLFSLASSISVHKSLPQSGDQACVGFSKMNCSLSSHVGMRTKICQFTRRRISMFIRMV